PRGVGTCDKETIGKLNILISHRYGIFTQHSRIGRHCTAHAQPRIGVDVVSAQVALHEFIGYIIFFSKTLARNIESDGIGAMVCDYGAKYCGSTFHRFGPTHALVRMMPAPTHLRIHEPVAPVLNNVVEIHAL